MRLVFCGTPDFAVPSLKAVLDAGHEVALVLTQPDRPAGRGMELQQSAVKKAAVEIGLPVEQPARLRNNTELQSRLEAINPDATVVVAFGQLIPNWMLDLPKYGNLNVHGSLLPKYRGAAPIQWAVANGEEHTGVSIMRLDQGMDTGPVYAKAVVDIGPDSTAAELYPQLAQVGAALLVEILSKLGGIQPLTQDESLATLAPKLTREDGRIDFARFSAQEIYNRWRGFSPWPGCWTIFRSKRLILSLIRPSTAPHPLEPGAVAATPEGLTVGCAENSSLLLLEVQPEGKSKISGQQFIRDFQVKTGEQLG